mgnify:CR=1 FL=1
MKVLAVGCHPDDLEINAFGTLAKCVKRGDEVYICGVTTGDQGHYKILPEELATIRVKEAAAAAEVIGAKEYYNLGGHDVLISRYDMELVNKLVDYIRKVSPDFIITQYKNDYMMDHEETSALVLRAAFMATLPHYCTKAGEYPENVPGNIPVYYMSADSRNIFNPTEYVDITEEIELKKKALQCHRSQTEWLGEHDNCDFIEDAISYNSVCGNHVGVKYAEVFRVCEHTGRTPKKNLLND